MLVVSAGVGTFVYTQVRRDLRGEVDMGLRARAQALLATGSVSAGIAASSGHLADNDEAFAQVLSADGRVLDATRSVRAAPLIDPRRLPGGRPLLVERTPAGLEPARLLVVPTTYRGARAYLVVGATMSDAREALSRLLVLFAVSLPAAVLISSLIGWLLAGAALRPMRRMSAEAASISAAEPDRRLHVPRGDSGLALLAETVNATFDRLQEALRRERAFVDNASHELRTPLTILRAEVDTALAQPREASELRAALRSAANEVEHLIRIAEGLLVLARANGGRIAVRRSPVVLSDLIDSGTDAFAGPAGIKDVELSAAAEAATVQIDPTLARQALDNIVANAIRHSPPGGRVMVRGVVDGDRVVMEVSDQGLGFSDETLANAFQPFNRRTGQNGGAGLGLSMVSAIAQAHGGGAWAENLACGGALVTIWFLAEAADPREVDRQLLSSPAADSG
jgi:two-component system OmpR family sensor kinase